MNEADRLVGDRDARLTGTSGPALGAGGPERRLSGPDWTRHLPTGTDASTVDLAAGGSLPGSWVAAWAAAPAGIALATPDGTRISAAELEERTGTAAGRLAAAGLGPGDRVLYSGASSVDYVVAYLAAHRLGLTVLPVNTGYTDRELAHVLADAKPAGAVVDDPARVGDLPVVTTADLAGLPARPAASTLDAVAPHDPALIVYTSGTTGVPKGAVLSHANLLASSHAVRLAWRLTPADRLALCLPLFHVHGLCVGLHTLLTTGGTVQLLPGFEPGAVADAVSAGGASVFFGVPTMYHRLAESPRLGELRGLRLAVSGSAPLPAELHHAVRAGSGLRVLERYGMTETIMLVSNPYDGERRAGTVGFPLPGVQLRLSPRDGGVHEIEVRGPNVFSGYLNRPAATAETFSADGWLRTGDLGTFDDDGYLRISGRAKELIISGGYNVYPREVEEVLRAHPGVADAAVAGEPSVEWGETVVAHVVPAPGADPDELRERLPGWCAERLVGYKRPRGWVFRPSIPRNALGKVLRHELRR